MQRPLGTFAATTTTSVADSSDPFRARRGPSSRAPSKHVDEYEAQQAKQTEQAVSPPQEGPEQALDAIPEWNDFVASGNGRGLDVMSILKVSFDFGAFFGHFLTRSFLHFSPFPTSHHSCCKILR